MLVSLLPQNTITNAEKLLAAADELAQTGECDATEIYSEAHELEQRMHGFLTSLERRRAVLDLTVVFYSHVHEVSQCWLTVSDVSPVCARCKPCLPCQM